MVATKIGNVNKLPDNIIFETLQGTLQDTRIELRKKFPWMSPEEFYRLGEEESPSGYTYFPMDYERKLT